MTEASQPTSAARGTPYAAGTTDAAGTPHATGTTDAAGDGLGPPARREPLVLAVLALIALITIWRGHVDGKLQGAYGTANPPFVLGLVTKTDPWLIVAVLVLGLGSALAPRLLDLRLRPLPFAVVLLLLAAAAGLSLNAARVGTYGWYAVFDLGPRGSFEAANEYLPGIPLLRWGIPNYLDRFAETVTSQPVNIAGHGPGPLLLMRAIGAETAQSLAALCIACAALCAPLTYWVGRTLVSERAARTAGLVAVFTPVMLLDGFTSFDAVYAAMGALAAALLLSRRVPLVVLGVAAFAICTVFSWALLGVGAAVALAVLFRDGWRRAAVLAAAMGAGFVAINGWLAVGYGYDPVGTLLATEGVYRNSLAQVRPYHFWVFGSPVAWGVMLGPVVLAAAVRAAIRRSPAAMAILIVVLIAAVAGFTKAETERIWLIFVPLAIVAAAPLLTRRRLPWVLGILALQALAVQVFAETVW